MESSGSIKNIQYIYFIINYWREGGLAKKTYKAYMSGNRKESEKKYINLLEEKSIHALGKTHIKKWFSGENSAQKLGKKKKMANPLQAILREYTHKKCFF